MKTPRALSGVLVVLLAACVSTPVEDVTGNVGEDVEGEGEGEGERDREGQGEPELPFGEPCEADRCLDGEILLVCGISSIYYDAINCTVNQGECGRVGQRDKCIAVGWECEDRCLDDRTMQYCEKDLSQTIFGCDEPGSDGASFEGYVCLPEGGRDPETGRTFPTCSPGPDAVVPAPECEYCDSYFSTGETCCDADCPCDLDCDDGEPACGSQDDPAEEEEDPAEGGGGGGYAPEDWTCPAEYYDAGDGCDCECGVYDPDCEDPDAEVFGCDEGEICSPPGECEPGEY